MDNNPSSSPTGASYTKNTRKLQINPSNTTYYAADKLPTYTLKQYNQYKSDPTQITETTFVYGNPEILEFICINFNGTDCLPTGEFSMEMLPNLKEVILSGNSNPPYTSFDFSQHFSQFPSLTVSMPNWSNLTTVTLGDNITGLGEKAFYGCSKLTAIDLPDGLTSIGNQAFKDCTSLTSLDIPKTVTTIGSQIFSGCTALEYLKTPVKALYSGAFANSYTKLKEAVLYPSDGVTEIPAGCFYGCTSLTSVNIPSGITSLANSAFGGCSNLSLNIPVGVTVAYGACNGCLSAVQPDDSSISKDGVTYDATTRTITITKQSEAAASKFGNVTQWQYKSGTKVAEGTTTFCPDNLVFQNTVPEGVYDASTFAPLVSITIDNSSAEKADFAAHFGTLTQDLSLAVNGGESLTMLSIPKTTKSLSVTNCANITELATGSPLFANREALKNAGLNLVLTTYSPRTNPACTSPITKLTLLEGITTLDTQAFAGMSELVTLDASACKATDFEGYEIFRNSPKLAKVVLPTTLKMISRGMFCDCKVLSDVNISSLSNLERIGAYAFYNSALTGSITLPSKVKVIENDALNVYSNDAGITELKLNNGLVEIWDNAININKLTTPMTLPASVKTIGYIYGYYGYDNISPTSGCALVKNDDLWYIKDTKTILPTTQATRSTPYNSETTTTSFGSEKLRLLKVLKEGDTYSTPADTWYLSSGAFRGRNDIKQIILNEGLENIAQGSLVFDANDYKPENMSQLRELVIPSTVKHIGLRGEYLYFIYEPQYAATGGAMGSTLDNAPNMAYLDYSKVKNENIDYANESYSYWYKDSSEISSRGSLRTYTPTLVYMPKGSTNGKDVSTAPNSYTATNLNVIYTEDGENFECPQLEFYDYMQNGGVGTRDDSYRGGRKYYAIPHAFTAGTAKLKRTFSNAVGGKKFTVCLPFAVSATEFGTFYEFTKFDKSTGELTFTPITTATTQPCTPYLFMPKDASVEISAENVEVSAVPDGIVENGKYATSVTELADGSKFIGVYEYHTVPDHHFNFTNDKFREVKPGAAFCAPFRGYFYLEGANLVEAKNMVAVYEDVVTGISTVEPFDPMMDMENDVWYNMQGQRVDNPRRGVFIHNGKKVILK